MRIMRELGYMMKGEGIRFLNLFYSKKRRKMAQGRGIRFGASPGGREGCGEGGVGVRPSENLEAAVRLTILIGVQTR